ncbi:hypothetical protein ACWDZ8_38840 [Streptomyces sp. NPDC003233]
MEAAPVLARRQPPAPRRASCGSVCVMPPRTSCACWHRWAVRGPVSPWPVPLGPRSGSARRSAACPECSQSPWISLAALAAWKRQATSSAPSRRAARRCTSTRRGSRVPYSSHSMRAATAWRYMSRRSLVPTGPAVFATRSTHKLLCRSRRWCMCGPRGGPVEYERFNEVLMMHGTISPLYPVIVSLDVVTVRLSLIISHNPGAWRTIATGRQC